MQKILSLKKEQGFTLLELLLVVAIIGILSAIAIPAFSAYLENVQRKTVLVELRQIESQIIAFFLENGRVPDTLVEIGISETDPWGNPYQYIPILDRPLSGKDKVQPRKDKFLHPLNSDFDLWSMGPDGASQLPLTAKASRDDIIRANDGAFWGTAEEY